MIGNVDGLIRVIGDDERGKDPSEAAFISIRADEERRGNAAFLGGSVIVLLLEWERTVPLYDSLLMILSLLFKSSP